MLQHASLASQPVLFLQQHSLCLHRIILSQKYSQPNCLLTIQLPRLDFAGWLCQDGVLSFLVCSWACGAGGAHAVALRYLSTPCTPPPKSQLPLYCAGCIERTPTPPPAPTPPLPRAPPYPPLFICILQTVDIMTIASGRVALALVVVAIL